MLHRFQTTVARAAIPWLNLNIANLLSFPTTASTPSSASNAARDAASVAARQDT